MDVPVHVAAHLQSVCEKEMLASTKCLVMVGSLDSTAVRHVLSVVGNRPQFIKSRTPLRGVAKRRRRGDGAAPGQHYDHESFSEIFFEEPETGSASESASTRTGHACRADGADAAGDRAGRAGRAPRAVVVYGDTNSTLAGALAAAKLRFRSRTSKRACGPSTSDARGAEPHPRRQALDALFLTTSR